MTNRWKALLAAFITASVVTVVGVLFFFEPIAKADTVNGPLAHPVLGFFVYVVFIVALFDWTARQINNAYKAAFVIGASQMLLVNVDYVLTGKRGIVTGAASALLMVVTWISVAAVYSYFTDWGKKKTDGANPVR